MLLLEGLRVEDGFEWRLNLVVQILEELLFNVQVILNGPSLRLAQPPRLQGLYPAPVQVGVG